MLLYLIISRVAEWIVGALKSIVQDSEVDITETAAAIWTTELRGASENDAKAVLESMMNNIGGDVVSLREPADPSSGQAMENGDGVTPRPLQGSVGSKLLQECCTLTLRDHFDYAKIVTCSLLALLAADGVTLSDALRRDITEHYVPQVC